MTGYSWGGSVNTTAMFAGAPTAFIFYDGIGMPTTRQAANGNRPIRINSVAAGYVTNGYADVDYSSVQTQGGTVFGNSGGTFRFRCVRTSGTMNVGRNSNGGGSTFFSDGGSQSGILVGSLDYHEVPSAAQSPAVTPGSAAGSANLSWAAPASNGDSAITGYDIDWATNAGFTTGTGTKSVGAVTSDTVTGLTPGLTYFFRVKAKNSVSTAAGTTAVVSGTVSALLGTVPGAPTALALTAGPGRIGATWTAPASDGGVAITSYEVDYATDAGFAIGLVALVAPGGVAARAHTVVGLVPGTLYFFRVRAINSVGSSAGSSAASTSVPDRGTLDVVQSAAVSVSGGVQVEIRSDGASPAVLTLGYTVFGTGTTFVTIATLSVGSSAADFALGGDPRNLALVADAAGSIYVIGRRGDDMSTVLVRRFVRSAVTTWAAAGVNSQALASASYPLVAFAGAFVDGSGVTPVATILVLARRAGAVGAGALSFATLDLAAIAASSGPAFISSGSDPSWLSTPPASAVDNSATVGVSALPGLASRLAILANGFAVVDVVNGAATGVSKSGAGTALATPWSRVLGVSSTAFAVLTVASGALSWTFYGANGGVLGSGTYGGANSQGGAFARQWDAFYDAVAGLVTVYYIADDAGARVLESIDVSPSTYAAAAPVSLTAALGAASSTNGAVRVPSGPVDERRVLVAAENLLSGVKSTAVLSDRSGNVVPTAPAAVDIAGFDAANAYLFVWAFGDPNPRDTQSAYELQVQRVSDAVDIVATGKVVSAALSRNVVAATLVNGVNYRWRVRAWDELDTVGAWSAYDTFTTSATGTLTVTSPTPDNVAGIENSSINIAWSYTQVDGYTQTQRRVRVIRVSDSSVLSDTTMQASTVANFTITAVPTDVPVRVEVSIVTTAPGTPTITTNRLVTSSYGEPMVPTITVSTADAYVEITVGNPAPTGSRPAVIVNAVDRRETLIGGAFLTVARIAPNGTYRDHAVKSGVQYDYRVRGITA